MSDRSRLLLGRLGNQSNCALRDHLVIGISDTGRRLVRGMCIHGAPDSLLFKGIQLMRIYTRGENQSLLIDHEIVVTVLAIYPDHVRVRIHSPRHEPATWESDLFLPDDVSVESLELELIVNGSLAAN